MLRRRRVGGEGMTSADEFATCALFLDLDGTVLDIGPTPLAIAIPDGLANTLARIERALGGAFAVLTGRTIGEVDTLLSPLRPIAAGVQGAQIRRSPGGVVELAAEPVEPAIIAAVADLVADEPGAVLELKENSVAVHFRQVPTAEPRIEAGLARILQNGPDTLCLSRGRKVLEILPRTVSKGRALETMMTLPQFRGRRPLMIGDDVSDLPAIERAIGLGGHGYRVAGEFFDADEAEFSGPHAVRSWLDDMARSMKS